MIAGRYTLTAPRERRPAAGLDGAGMRGPVTVVRAGPAQPVLTRRDPAPELAMRLRHEPTSPREREVDATPSSRPGAIPGLLRWSEGLVDPDPPSEPGLLTYEEENDDNDDARRS